MHTSQYQQLRYALCAENGRWTMNGLRSMIGNEAAYKRWLERYVFERYGLDRRSVQIEMRREFIKTFQVAYEAETGKPLPLKPNDARSEFPHIFAD